MLTLPPAVAAAEAGLVALVDDLVARHGRDRSALVPVLTAIQAERHEISDLAMQLVADRFGVPPVDVEGVVTFYAFLGSARRGTHSVRVCRTLSCELAGAAALTERLAADLGVAAPGGTTSDGTATLELVHCIGLCDHAPAMLVDDVAHVDLDPARASRAVAAALAPDDGG